MDQQTATQILNLLQEQATRDTGNPVLNLILGLGVAAIIVAGIVYTVLKFKGPGEREGTKEDRGKFQELLNQREKISEELSALRREVKDDMADLRADVKKEVESSENRLSQQIANVNAMFTQFIQNQAK